MFALKLWVAALLSKQSLKCRYKVISSDLQRLGVRQLEPFEFRSVLHPNKFGVHPLAVYDALAFGVVVYPARPFEKGIVDKACVTRHLSELLQLLIRWIQLKFVCAFYFDTICHVTKLSKFGRHGRDVPPSPSINSLLVYQKSNKLSIQEDSLKHVSFIPDLKERGFHGLEARVP